MIFVVILKRHTAGWDLNGEEVGSEGEFPEGGIGGAW